MKGTTRRDLVLGAGACACVGTASTDARAFFQAMKAGIDALVSLWNGYKMAKEVYEEFFKEKSKPVTTEIKRYYTTQNYFIQNYYHLGNPYKMAGLGSAEPGCEAIASSRQSNSTALCCGAADGPILLPTGCIIALYAAMDHLRATMQDDNVFAYTRPLRYERAAAPMSQIETLEFASDVQYYSPAGSVALGWVISDTERRISRGQYRIRDDSSGRIVAVGQTANFSY